MPLYWLRGHRQNQGAAVGEPGLQRAPLLAPEPGNALPVTTAILGLVLSQETRVNSLCRGRIQTLEGRLPRRRGAGLGGNAMRGQCSHQLISLWGTDSWLSFRVTSDGAQGPVLALCSGATFGGAGMGWGTS